MSEVQPKPVGANTAASGSAVPAATPKGQPSALPPVAQHVQAVGTQQRLSPIGAVPGSIRQHTGGAPRTFTPKKISGLGDLLSVIYYKVASLFLDAGPKQVIDKIRGYVNLVNEIKVNDLSALLVRTIDKRAIAELFQVNFDMVAHALGSNSAAEELLVRLYADEQDPNTKASTWLPTIATVALGKENVTENMNRLLGTHPDGGMLSPQDALQKLAQQIQASSLVKRLNIPQNIIKEFTASSVVSLVSLATGVITGNLGAIGEVGIQDSMHERSQDLNQSLQRLAQLYPLIAADQWPELASNDALVRSFHHLLSQCNEGEKDIIQMTLAHFSALAPNEVSNESVVAFFDKLEATDLSTKPYVQQAAGAGGGMFIGSSIEKGIQVMKQLLGPEKAKHFTHQLVAHWMIVAATPQSSLFSIAQCITLVDKLKSQFSSEEFQTVVQMIKGGPEVYKGILSVDGYNNLVKGLALADVSEKQRTDAENVLRNFPKLEAYENDVEKTSTRLEALLIDNKAKGKNVYCFVHDLQYERMDLCIVAAGGRNVQYQVDTSKLPKICIVGEVQDKYETFDTIDAAVKARCDTKYPCITLASVERA